MRTLVDFAAPLVVLCSSLGDPLRVQDPVNSAASSPATPPADAENPFELPGAFANLTATWKRDVAPFATPSDLGREGEVPRLPSASESGVEAWREPATWASWSALVASARATALRDEPTRARLALLALTHRRYDDAWRHLEVAATRPDVLAAYLPCFLPGPPPGTRLALGGTVQTLADGACIAPSLPPPSGSPDSGRVDRREMTVRELAIGAGVVSVRVAVESEGVQIDVKHVRGGECSLAVLLPMLTEFEYATVYLDWERVEDFAAAHVIRAKPGEDAHTLYGRFEARETAWPSRVPLELPSQLRRGELWLLVRAGDPERARLEAVAQALNGVGLGLRAEVREESASPGPCGIVVDLRDERTRMRKLAWLASAVERFALGDGG